MFIDRIYGGRRLYRFHLGGRLKFVFVRKIVCSILKNLVEASTH